VSDDDDELAGDAAHELFVTEADAGARLDAVIAARIPALSRTQAQRLIEEGTVTVDGVVAVKVGARVDAGARIEVSIPAPVPLDVAPEPIELAVLFEDADLIVIDKPAGMVVHPAPGHAGGTLVNALLHHCADLSGIGGVARPGIVHRLDRDTSGVMVAAKTDRAHAALAAAFAQKSAGQVSALAIERSYLAITAPAPPTGRGTLRTQYGRHPVDRKRFSSRVSGGKSAVTHYAIEERLRDAALVRFTLETGRTHQIRVHAADHGFAVLGDATYGKRSPLIARQALHAAYLAFDHPVSGARHTFEVSPPDDFERALAALRA
jgi:23S rRNA pseudouridine1911/1915/1917 synthase